MSIRIDEVRGQRLKWTFDGWRHTRVFKVFDMPNPAAGSPATSRPLMDVIYRAVPNVIPKPGDFHPSFSWTVDDIDVAPLDNSTRNFIVHVSYRDIFTIKAWMNGTLIRDTTIFDFTGEAMRVLYKPPPQDPDAEPARGLHDTLEQVFEADVYFPSVVLEFELATTEPAEVDMIAKWVGRTNAKKFQGQEADAWLCTNSQVRRVNLEEGGVDNIDTNPLWLAKVSFQHAPQGNSWDQIGVYRNQKDHIIPFSINPSRDPKKTSGNGWRRFSVMFPADFAKIAFPAIITSPL